MPFQPADFEADTDFERLAIGRLGTHPLWPVKSGMAYHLGPGGSQSVAVEAPVMTAGALRDDLREKLRPLSFAAAYKVLDMLVEHVLRANGDRSDRMDFKYKSGRLASRPNALPVPLDSRPEVWDRLAKLYSNLLDARHAVVHRRAVLDKSGELAIYDDQHQRRQTDRLSKEEVGAFMAAVHVAAEVVIARDKDARRLGLIAGYLNQLTGRHRLPLLPDAVDPDREVRLLTMDLEALGDDRWRMDVARAREVCLSSHPRFGSSSCVLAIEYSPGAGRMCRISLPPPWTFTRMRPHPGLTNSSSESGRGPGQASPRSFAVARSSTAGSQDVA